MRQAARSALVLMLLCATNLGHPQAQSQAQELTPEAHVTAEQIQRWLFAADPRLIAWGAYFAAQQNDPAGLALLPALLDRALPVAPPSETTDRASLDRYLEAVALLHSLISTGNTAPAATLAQLASVFPAQALILAARLPVAERTSLLLRWYDVQDQNHYGDLTRTSAMLLAKAPPPGFAARLLTDTTAHLRIAAVANGDSTGLAASGACGDSMSGAPDPTWPPMFRYELQTTRPDSRAKLLVQTGDLRVLSLAVPFNSGYGHCSDQEPDFHHAVLSQMLGIPEKSMPWQISSFHTVEWVDAAHFTASVQTLVAAERATLDSTATALARKDLITPAEPAARPTLAVKIDDSRQDKSAPLPALRFEDPRTIEESKDSPAP